MICCRVTAEPLVNVSFNPPEPTTLSALTATANITSDDEIQEVHIVFKECNPTTCFRRENVTMTLSDDNYSADIILEKEQVTFISYYFSIFSNDTWYETESANLTLKASSGNENTDVDGSDDNNAMPGFELISFLIASVVLILFFYRKRSR